MGLIRIAAILLLTVRVLASPLAMRPESPKAASKYRLVARLGAWPVPRPHRSVSASSFVLESPFKTPHHRQKLNLSFGPYTLLGSIFSTFVGPTGLKSQSPLLRRMPLHLRC